MTHVDVVVIVFVVVCLLCRPARYIKCFQFHLQLVAVPTQYAVWIHTQKKKAFQYTQRSCHEGKSVGRILKNRFWMYIFLYVSVTGFERTSGFGSIVYFPWQCMWPELRRRSVKKHEQNELKEVCKSRSFRCKTILMVGEGTALWSFTYVNDSEMKLQYRELNRSGESTLVICLNMFASGPLLWDPLANRFMLRYMKIVY